MPPKTLYLHQEQIQYLETLGYDNPSKAARVVIEEHREARA